MAYSYVRYTGNGSTQNYTFSFPYINQDHIKVRVNGEITTAWSFLNSSTVQFTSAPASGAILEIRRETPKDSAIVNFTDGSVLLERDLDLLATYDLYLAQETKDGLDASITQTSLGVFDGQSKRITNVADPVNAQDAVTKNWVETTYTPVIQGYSVASAASATAAAGSATASANSASAAAASYDSFDDRYLGAKAVAPTLDNDGNALLTGAVFWDTVSNQMFVWSGSQWKPTFLTGNAVRSLITATAGQTVFTVPTYVVAANTLQVFVNGIKVLVSSDYTETNQNTITFGAGLSAGDEVEVIALQPYAIGTTGAESVSFQPAGSGSVLTTVANALLSHEKFATAMPKSTNDPAEDFDKAEGTLLAAITTVSGHVLSAAGTGAASLQVNTGGAYATSNVYMGLTSPNLVRKVSGAFGYAPASGTAGQCVIMFNGSATNTTLDKLIHLEITSANVVMKFTTTGAGNLSAPTGTVKERSGKLNSQNYFAPIFRNFTPYHISMEYTQGATDLDDVISVYLPDGRILEFSGDARIRVVMSTCYHGTWQLTGNAPRWYNIALNETRQQMRDSLVRNASIQQVASLVDTAPVYSRFKSTVVYPTGIGWYKVIGQVSESGAFSGIVGTVRIYGRDNAGRLDYAELFLNSYSTAANSITLIKRGYGGYGGNHLGNVRLSYDSGTGARQFEIYVGTYQAPTDYVVVEFDGAGTLVSSPVVGSTALTTSREQVIYDLVSGVRNESSITTRTFTPGIDQQKNILINNYSGSVDFFVDNTKAYNTDEFFFARPTGVVNNAVIKNTSDSSTIVTLAPGQTAWLGVVSGKFVAYSKGTV